MPTLTERFDTGRCGVCGGLFRVSGLISGPSGTFCDGCAPRPEEGWSAGFQCPATGEGMNASYCPDGWGFTGSRHDAGRRCLWIEADEDPSVLHADTFDWLRLIAGESGGRVYRDFGTAWVPVASDEAARAILKQSGVNSDDLA